MLLAEFTRRISLAEVTHWARSDTAALRTSRRRGWGWMSQRFLRYTISPRVLILPAGRYSTRYYAGGGEQCGLYGENASIAFLIRNPRAGDGDGNSLPPALPPRSAASGYAVLVNVSPRTDLTWLAIIKWYRRRNMHLNYRPAIIICIPPRGASPPLRWAPGSLSLAPFNLNNTSRRGGSRGRGKIYIKSP